MTAPVRVRAVDYPDRIEVHAAVCGHRVASSRQPIVTVRDESVESLRALYDECVAFGTQQVVMPCLSKLIGSAP